MQCVAAAKSRLSKLMLAFTEKTDRIDLDSFYPVFACIAEDVRMRVREPHIALRHKIINAPNPKTPAEVLRNGQYARVVQLGEPVNMSQFRPDQSHWWPRGESPTVRGKLFRRISREGKVLPIVAGTCIAIMFRMYSTPNAATPITMRLRYKSSSLADFGVIFGRARVIPDDQLVYVLPNGTIQRGQDPNKHYWIYFETQKGETVYLDCSLYTCVLVACLPFICPQAMFTPTRILPLPAFGIVSCARTLEPRKPSNGTKAHFIFARRNVTSCLGIH